MLTALKCSGTSVTVGSLVSATTVRVIAGAAGVVCAVAGAGSTIAPSNHSPVVLNCMNASQVQRIIGAPYALPAPLGLAGRCERTVVKCVNIGDVENYASPPRPAPLGRLDDEVKIAHPCSKAGEGRLFAAMQDFKPQGAVESDSSWHFVG